MVLDVLASVVRIEVLVPWIIGMALGVFIGAMPGLSATMATAILIPITYHLLPMGGLAMIIGCVLSPSSPVTYRRSI